MIDPSSDTVRSYLEKWNTDKSLENYRTQEAALKLLFHKFCLEISSSELVLLKVTALNQFYSTNIYDTYSMAKHIIDLEIDERLHSGDLTLVNELALITLKSKQKNFYSFASKYCSHHDPKAFPIYDSFVEKMLVRCAKVGHFAQFKKVELKKYKSFVQIIKTFQQFYGLENFSLREIDMFLWLAGKELFPRWPKNASTRDSDWIQNPPAPAPEARQKVAHGETVGLIVTKFQAPAGAAENHQRKFLSPHPGLCLFVH
jgi:hypothetical protein